MAFSPEPIPLNVFGNLTTDLIKRLAKNPYAPIDNAIARTSAAFPQYEGLPATLREWLNSLKVAKALTQYVEGRRGRKDISLKRLAAVLTRHTQFYLPNGTEAATRKIVSRFLVEIRTEYLKLPERGLPHIANRLEILRAESWEQFEELKACEPPLRIDRPAKLTRERIDPLLRPYNAFIDMIGRASELSEIEAFCDDLAAFRWKVLTGYGGVGKTRLALELAKRREQSGWRAGFLSTESLKSWLGRDRFQTWAPVTDMLVIIDYAGGRTDHVKTLLERCGRWAEEKDGQARVRLLLLEREADPESGWLHGLLSSPQGSLRDQIEGALAPVREIKEPGGRDSDAAIVEILRATFDAWSRLPGEGKSPPFPALDEAALRELRRQTEGRPLLLQMAALRACDHDRPEMLTEWKREDLLNYVVGRERHYAEQRFGAGTTRALLAERAIAFLTFTGPIAKNDPRWLKLLAGDAETRGFPHAEPGEVSEDVAALLGESQDGGASGIVPLGPDLLAEAFAVAVFSAGSGSAVGAIEAALECAGPVAWVSLLRGAVDLYGLEKLGIIESWLVWLIPGRARPELYVVEALIPEHSVALRRIAAAVGESQLRALAPGEKEDPERARILNNLANRYSDLGRREEALGAAERASAIYERLAKQNPDAFEPDLATSLNNLGNRYSELGRREEALGAAERAVAIRERLAKQNPDAFEPDLAASLNNLGGCYSALGKREKALGAAERASVIYGRLAQQNPDAFEPDLAASLNNLGNRYSELGRREEALGAAERASAIYQRLAQQNPDAFEPNLAASLNNLGGFYGDLGRREEALGAAERASAIYQRLAQQNPDAFEPDLAMSLGALGTIWREGNPSQAADAFRRGVETLRRLFLRHPKAFAPLMAALLKGYLEACQSSGQEPDFPLLAPIAEAFKGTPPTQ
jgi:tetratricopeptide (TPR) repeat protein